MTIKSWIEDLDVDGVDLVGDPANRRPFAIVKNLAGRSPRHEEPTVTKRQELIDRLQKGQGAEIPASELIELVGRDPLVKAIAAGEGGRDVLLKALGQDPTPTKKGADDDASFGDKVLAALRKMFGGTPDQTTAAREALLKGLPAEARAYVEGLEGSVGTLTKKVEEVVKAREDEGKAAIRKRAEALKARGVEIDVEKATAVEVAAHESAQAQIDKALEELGVTRVHGSAKDGKGERSAREEVEKEVQRRVGGRTADKVELARVRRQVYADHPGLLQAVRKEERAERAHA